MGNSVKVDIAVSLKRRLPFSLDQLVVTPPEFLNHGSDCYRWRVQSPDGFPIGQVRVYSGRINEMGKQEQVFIPARAQVTSQSFLLPHAELFSRYLRDQIGEYLKSEKHTDRTKPTDSILRRGPTILGTFGTTYFLRWNIYFKDNKIGEYTVHDNEPEKQAADQEKSYKGEISYRGIIPGYSNPHIIAWNQACVEVTTRKLKQEELLPKERVVFIYGRTLAKETSETRFSLAWQRIDNNLNIPFP